MVERDCSVAEHGDDFFAAEFDGSNAVLSRCVWPGRKLEAHTFRGDDLDEETERLADQHGVWADAKSHLHR